MTPQGVICLQALSAVMLWHRTELAILIFVLALRWRWPERRPEVLWAADPCLLNVLLLVEQGNADSAFQNARVNPPGSDFRL